MPPGESKQEEVRNLDTYEVDGGDRDGREGREARFDEKHLTDWVRQASASAGVRM
jgi:hypothetical protein